MPDALANNLSSPTKIENPTLPPALSRKISELQIPNVPAPSEMFEPGVKCNPPVYTPGVEQRYSGILKGADYGHEVTVIVPKDYDPTKPPKVNVLLHGLLRGESFSSYDWSLPYLKEEYLPKNAIFVLPGSDYVDSNHSLPTYDKYFGGAYGRKGKYGMDHFMDAFQKGLDRAHLSPGGAIDSISISAHSGGGNTLAGIAREMSPALAQKVSDLNFIDATYQDATVDIKKLLANNAKAKVNIFYAEGNDSHNSPGTSLTVNGLKEHLNVSSFDVAKTLTYDEIEEQLKNSKTSVNFFKFPKNITTPAVGTHPMLTAHNTSMFRTLGIIANLYLKDQNAA